MNDHLDVVSQRDICLVVRGLKPAAICGFSFYKPGVYYERKEIKSKLIGERLQTRAGETTLEEVVDSIGLAFAPIRIISEDAEFEGERTVRHGLQFAVAKDKKGLKELELAYQGNFVEEQLGYPLKVIVGSLNLRKDGKMNNNYNLMKDLIKARDGRKFIPTWLAYLIHIPSEEDAMPHPRPFVPGALDFANEEYPESCENLARDYRFNIMACDPELPHKIEEDFDMRIENLRLDNLKEH